MSEKRIKTVKHAQRESFFLKEISAFFMQISLDEKSLSNCYVTRAELSPDRGTVTIYFHNSGGKENFDSKTLKTLILYKPSLRAALAKISHSRYTPELKFVYDSGIDKQNQIEDLFARLASEGKI